MKVLVESVDKEGLEALLGKRITLFCSAYIYTGKLIGVNDTCVKLTDCGIVYETGEFSTPTWKDYQKLPKDFYVRTQSIESFGELK